MEWLPVRIGFVGSDLQVNQIRFAFVMVRHCRKRFPINALFINAESAPIRLVLKYLVR